MFNIELKRAITRKPFLIVLVVGFLLALLDVLTNDTIQLSGMDFYDYPLGVYEWWILYSINEYNMILSIILPLLVAMAYSDSYAEDINSGFSKNIFTRYSKNKYLRTKFFVNFIIGGFVGSVPFLTNLILYLMLIPSIEPNLFFGTNFMTDQGFLPELYYSYPMAHVLLRTFMCFVYGGALASFGLACSVFVKNRYVIVIIPITLYILLDIVLSVFSLSEFSPFKILFVNTPYNNGTFIIPLILVSISYFCFLIGGKYNEDI